MTRGSVASPDALSRPAASGIQVYTSGLPPPPNAKLRRQS